MAEGEIRIKVKSNLKRTARDVNAVSKAFKRTTGSAKQLSNVAGNLGSRLGFVAFQFTFMAGVAGRALQDIGRRMAEFTQEGSKDLSSIGRAISRSGFDISSTFGESKEAVDLLNNAIRTFGSGGTIFTVQEAAEAFNAVGRAVTFTGTELERAQQQIVITKNVLNLMTIEEQGAEAAAINLIKTMKQFGLSVQDAAHAADVLVAVNNQSSITLDGLVRSLGFAGQQARQFGITFEDTAVILGVIQDRLGVLNGGPGRNFSILLESLSDTTTSLNSTLAGFGIRIRDAKGNLLPFNSILTQTKKALERTGGAGTLANEIILEQISTTSRGARALLALIQGFDELQISFDNLAESEGIAADLAARFGELPEERIKRLKNAINALRVEFVGGLAPALGQIVDSLRSVATDTNIQEFMINLGQVIGTTVIPFVQSLAKQFKLIAAVLGKNELVLKAVTGLFIGLVGVLATLFIVGTLGALIAVMASSVARLATSTAFLTVVTNAWFLSLLRIMAVAVGVFLVIKALDNIVGILKDGITASEVPALALNAAMVLLGGTLLGLGTGIVTLGGLKTAITGLSLAKIGGVFSITGFKNTIGAMRLAIFGLAGASTATRVTAGMEGLGGKAGTSYGKGLLPMLKGLSKGPIIIAAVAAAAIIAIAFTAKMLSEAENSPMFKSGLVDKWDIVGFKMQLATAKTIKGIIDFFLNLEKNINEIFADIAKTAFQIVDAFKAGDFKRGLAIAQGALRSFRDTFTKVFTGDVDKLTRDFLIKTIKAANETGKALSDPGVIDSIREILRENFEAGGTLTDEDVNDIFRDVFGIIIPIGGTGANAEGITEAQKEVAIALETERDDILRRLALAQQNTFDPLDPTGGGFDSSKLLEELGMELLDVDKKINALGDSLGLDSALSIGDILEKFTTAGGIVVEQFATVEELLKAMEDRIKEVNDGFGEGIGISDSLTIVITRANDVAETFEDLPQVIEDTKEAILEDTGIIEESIEARIALNEAELASAIAQQESELQAIQSAADKGISTKQTIEREKELRESLGKLKEEQDKVKLSETASNIAIKAGTVTAQGLKEIEDTKIATETIQNNLLDQINGLYKSSFIPIIFQQMQAYLRVEANMNLLDDDLTNLRKAIVELTERISKTRVKFKKNDEGEITGFKLVGGVSKDDANNNFGFLASGGIVTGPTRAIIGEKEPEAVIPLSKLEGITGGNSVGDISITIEGNATEDNIEQMTDAIDDIINNRIKNKPILR